MTSTSTSPLRDLFRSSPSKGADPTNELDLGSPSRLQKLFLRNKTTGADQDYTKISSTTAQPRSILYNFIMASGTTTITKEQRRSSSPRPSQQTSMLLPPLSLFPSATSPKMTDAEKAKQSKSGLFAKGKKESVAGIGAAAPSKNAKGHISSKDKKPPMASDTSTASTRPWGMWTSGGSGDTTPQITISQVENAKRTKDSGARRMWKSMSPSRSEESFHNKDEVHETTRKKNKFLKSSWSSQSKSPSTRSEEYEQEQHHQQIMLHSSSNISSRSVTTPRYPQRTDEQEQQRTVGQVQCSNLCQSSPQHQAQSRFNVTIAVHDVFGVGKVTEMMLALFLAHDSFLCRRPFWLQCSILAWEAVVALMVIWMSMMAIWTVMRVVGVAEILVQGADDLVRGTFSVLRQFAQSIRMILFAR